MIASFKKGELFLVITTERNYYNAKKLAKSIVSKKLAACVSYEQIQSVYCWNDEIIEESEVQLDIKVKSDLVADLYDSLKELHSYELPQFICFNALVSEEYFQWCSGNI